VCYQPPFPSRPQAPSLGSRKFKERVGSAEFFQYAVHTNPDVPLGTLLNLVRYTALPRGAESVSPPRTANDRRPSPTLIAVRQE
jgi:hypothetical protein